jgi:hypothetical protein
MMANRHSVGGRMSNTTLLSQASAQAPAAGASSAMAAPAAPGGMLDASGTGFPMTLVLMMVLLGAAWLGLVVFRRKLMSGQPGWLQRLRSPGAGQDALQVVDRLQLTPQASVHIIRRGDEELIVGCTPQQVTLLSRRTGVGDGRSGAGDQGAIAE